MQPDLRGLGEVDVVGLPDETVRSELLAALAALNQLSAHVARLADSFDVRDLAETDGFRTARVWLSAFGRLSPAGASAWLARGRLLRALPALAAAAGQGHGLFRASGQGAGPGHPGRCGQAGPVR
jgi:hypothetical protein